jgi:hypothetical protein
MAPYCVNSTTGPPHRQIGQRQVMNFESDSETMTSASGPPPTFAQKAAMSALGREADQGLAGRRGRLLTRCSLSEG